MFYGLCVVGHFVGAPCSFIEFRTEYGGVHMSKCTEIEFGIPCAGPGHQSVHERHTCRGANIVFIATNGAICARQVQAPRDMLRVSMQ